MIGGGKAISMCENFELCDLENTLLILRCIGSLNMLKYFMRKEGRQKSPKVFCPPLHNCYHLTPVEMKFKLSLLLDCNIKQA